MLAGLPVIAVDVGGIRDYGVDGENMLKLSAATAEAALARFSALMLISPCASASGKQARADMLRSYDALHAGSKWRRRLLT